MFSLYGLSGPIFQGTLESLGRFAPVAPRPPVTPLRRIGDQFEVAPTTEEGGGGGTRASPAGQAVEAYQAMSPQELDRGPLYLANQLMQPEVITVRAEDGVTSAWSTLVGHRIHQAPVLDASDRLVGIVSERNLLASLNVEAGQVRDVMDKRVTDVMTTPVVAASPATDIRRIARVMLDQDVDGVPIVNDSGALIGFVSRGDILAAVVRDPPLSIWR